MIGGVGHPGVCTSPVLLPSHSSFPPTPFALPCPSRKGGYKSAKEVGGQEEWEIRRSGREGGVGGHKESQGKRSGRAGGVGGHEEWEGLRSGGQEEWEGM